MDSLFRIQNGKATITDHTRTIWYYDNLIEKYGEDDAVKLFTVFQFMADLIRGTNPFAEVSEEKKLETIIRSVCPEMHISIDWDDSEITECIELTRELFNTPSYRKYLASKVLVDKLTYELETTHVDLTKEGGNSSQLKAAYDLFKIVKEETDKMYEAYLSEQEGMVQVRGEGNKRMNRNPGGKSKELE